MALEFWRGAYRPESSQRAGPPCPRRARRLSSRAAPVRPSAGPPWIHGPGQGLGIASLHFLPSSPAHSPSASHIPMPLTPSLHAGLPAAIEAHKARPCSHPSPPTRRPHRRPPSPCRRVSFQLRGWGRGAGRGAQGLPARPSGARASGEGRRLGNGMAARPRQGSESTVSNKGCSARVCVGRARRWRVELGCLGRLGLSSPGLSGTFGAADQAAKALQG